MVETLTCRGCGAEVMAGSIRCPSCNSRLTPLRAAGRVPKSVAAGSAPTIDDSSSQPMSDAPGGAAESAESAAMDGEQSPAGGGWHPDPTGKHEMRWWDGQQWTEHTSTNGVQAVDPM